MITQISFPLDLKIGSYLVDLEINSYLLNFVMAQICCTQFTDGLRERKISLHCLFFMLAVDVWIANVWMQNVLQ